MPDSNAASWVGLLGLVASAIGIFASFLLARPGRRNEGTEAKMVTLQQLARRLSPTNGKGKQPDRSAQADFSELMNDLEKELIQKIADNRVDLTWGSRLLGLAFLILVAQSLAMIFL